MVVDQFHFKNHVDSWCKQNCNPYSSDDLQVMNWISYTAFLVKVFVRLNYVK